MDNGNSVEYMSLFEKRGTHFHFVGIKGTGMAALAELLAAQGAVITGSDVSEVFYTDEILNNLGITALPFCKDNITDKVECVVHSSAYSTDSNSDLIEAARRGLPIVLYTEALGAVSALHYSAGICGVHGKTSTTGLAGTILSFLPLPSCALAGSVITSFGAPPVHSCVMIHKMDSRHCEGGEETPSRHSGGSQAGGKRNGGFFVAETCEYQRHFMQFHPQKIVLTSVESDHQDYYPSYEDILQAFVEYLLLLPDGGEVIYCADDKGATEAVEAAAKKRPDIKKTPYGFTAAGDYRVTIGSIGDGAQHSSTGSLQRFALGCMSGLELHIAGRHEVLDAAGAVALCRALLAADGKNPAGYDDEIRKGVAAFTGGKRRSEVVGHCKIGGNDVIFIDDYGHHPTAIRTTLQGYRQFYGGRRIVVDFMSHTHTRTAALLDEFASSFSDADDVIINKIYGSAREGNADEMIVDGKAISGKVLSQAAMKHHKSVIYAANFDEAAEEALRLLSEPLDAQFPNGCLFVTMGAGDNWKVGEIVMKCKK